MRYVSMIALALAFQCGLAVGAESTTRSQLFGVWDVTEMQNDGKDVSLDEIAIRFEFTESQLILRVSERSNITSETKPSHVFDFKIDADGKLKTLDLSTANNSPGPETGLNIHAIYKIEGDKLLVCYADDHDDAKRDLRPSDFKSTSNAKSHLYTLTRVASE